MNHTSVQAYKLLRALKHTVFDPFRRTSAPLFDTNGTADIDYTAECPLPPLPVSNIIIATEAFEHLHEPISYLLAFDKVLEPGGYLYTQIADHRREFMHVSPNLSEVRQKLAELGYRELRPYRLFEKPAV